MSDFNYNMKLNISAICKYEALTQKSFFAFEQNTEISSVLFMLYSVLLSHEENNLNCTFGEFVLKFKQKDIKKLSDALQKQIEISNQFVPKFALDEEESALMMDSSTNNKVNDNPIFVTELVPILIYDCGLDANYVYNDLDINYIQLFLKYRERRERADLIEKRFWTYLQMCPHINTKKCRSAEQLLPFAWEKEEKKKKELKNMKDVRGKLLELGILHNDNNTSTNENGEH